MNSTIDARAAFAAEFEKLRGKGPAWLHTRRAAAFDSFAGFPTPDHEDWRFTDLAPIAERSWRPAGYAMVSKAFVDGPMKSCQIAFINGRFSPEHSAMPKGVTVETGLLEAPPAKDLAAFAALNAAFAVDQALIRIERALTTPIHLLFIATGPGTANFPRTTIVAEPGASAAIVESYVGGGGTLTDALTEIVVGTNASIDYHKLQREHTESYHVHALTVRQAASSRFSSHSIALGAAISRSEILAVLDGEGAECVLNGLYEVTGRQHADNHTSIVHAKPHTTSRELYKGILDGHSRAVFDGRIAVKPDAQKTSAMQTNKNLLLSADALVNTKPQLEIFANDVKCKHGATIGQLDRDMLFYIRSRGLGLEEARRLLVHAFASEIMDNIKVEAIRAQMTGCLLTMIQ